MSGTEVGVLARSWKSHEILTLAHHQVDEGTDHEKQHSEKPRVTRAESSIQARVPIKQEVHQDRDTPKGERFPVSGR